MEADIVGTGLDVAVGRHLRSSPTIVAALLIALSFLAGCGGQPTSSSNSPAATLASAAPIPAGSPPPGGPVPAELVGVWILHTTNPDPGLAADGIINDKLQLTLTTTTYGVVTVNNDPIPRNPEAGAVVVNKSEIDFFAETAGHPFCPLQPPDGVGRYTWTLVGGVLHFATVVETGYFGDPCGRLDLADQSYIRSK